MPQDEDAGEESQNVEGEIDHHKGAATPLSGGGRIRIHRGIDCEEAESIKSGNQTKKDEGDRTGIQAGENEGGPGDVV